MSDSRLRELERRWLETGAPEERAAFVRESLRHAPDSEAALDAAPTPARDPGPILDRIEQRVGKASTTDARAAGLAHLSKVREWIGDRDGARRLLGEAQDYLEPHGGARRALRQRSSSRPWELLEARIDVAAASARQEPWDVVSTRLIDALDEARRLGREHAPFTPERSRGRRFEQRWIEVVARVPWAGRADLGSDLQRAALALVDRVTPFERSSLLEASAEPLRVIGLGDAAAERAEALLGADVLAETRAAIEDETPDWVDRAGMFRIHQSNALRSCALLRQPSLAPGWIRERLESLVRAHPELVDEFLLLPLRWVLSAPEARAGGHAERLAAFLSAEGRETASLMVRLADLSCRGTGEAPRPGAALEILDAVVGLAAPAETADLLDLTPHAVARRVLDLAPHLAGDDEGREAIERGLRELPRFARASTFSAPEVLGGMAAGVARLSDRAVRAQLFSEVSTVALAEVTARQAVTWWLYLEPLQACLAGALVQDPQVAARLLEDIREVLCAGEAQNPGAGGYHIASCWSSCADAAESLGLDFSPDLERVRIELQRLSEFDRGEVLEQLASSVGRARGRLETSRLELLSGALEGCDDDQLVELLRRAGSSCAPDTVLPPGTELEP